MKKIISFALSFFLLLSVCACGGEGQQSSSGNSEAYSKESATELYFYSSDKDLDLFLNDFYKRHSRSSLEYAINAMELGQSGSCWKDWESMSLLWFDSTIANFREDSFSLIRQWLYSIPVDDYGYVWSSSSSEKANEDPKGSNFGMGWPFPNYGAHREYDWEFNSKGKDEGWSAYAVGASLTPYSANYVADGYYSFNVSGASEVGYRIADKKMPTFSNPFLEFDIRWALGGSYEDCVVDDIYVTFKVQGSDEKYTVKQSDLTERTIDMCNLYTNHVYMPMYLDEHWGTDNKITDIEIAVKAKDGKTLTGAFWLNFVRGNYDSRQIDNIFCYVSTLKQYYEFTGDKQVLKDNIDRYRKAVMFLVYNLGGESGLIDLSKFVGHNGGTVADGTANSISSSYWDVLSFSPKSLYAQVLYYETLQAALYLEEAVRAENFTAGQPSVKLFDGGYADSAISPDRIIELMSDVKANVQRPVNTATKTGFYDEEKGRFIEGFNMRGDVVDYGSTIFNNMAVSVGLATSSQAKSVCAWVNGDRIIAGDNARGYTGDIDDPDNAGIYDYEFAPRVTTKKNSEQYTAGHGPNANGVYGASCQDGGAIMFTSYYDMAARFVANGKEDAFKRLSGIKDWYLKVYEYSAEDYGATYFYRAYYDDLGISLQGFDTAGSLGLDAEFLESAIVYAIVPDVFFGLEGTSGGKLSVTPSLPSGLSFWRMENLMYHNVRYDLQIGKNYVLIESVRGNTLNEKVVVNFAYTGSDPAVYVDGVKLDRSAYTFKNNVVSVETDFSAKKLEVK